jgi:hypothetical protein
VHLRRAARSKPTCRSRGRTRAASRQSLMVTARRSCASTQRWPRINGVVARSLTSALVARVPRTY